MKCVTLTVCNYFSNWTKKNLWKICDEKIMWQKIRGQFFSTINTEKFKSGKTHRLWKLTTITKNTWLQTTFSSYRVLRCDTLPWFFVPNETLSSYRVFRCIWIKILAIIILVVLPCFHLPRRQTANSFELPSVNGNETA